MCRIQHLKQYFIPKYRKKAQEESAALALPISVLDVGNQLGSDSLINLWTLEGGMEIKLTPGAIIWEVDYHGARYKLEVIY